MSVDNVESGPGSGAVCVASTSVGRVRTRNEDAFLLRPEQGLFVIADGMGGHQRGDVAARMCVEAIDEWFGDRIDSQLRNRLFGLVRGALGLRSRVETDLLAAIEYANRCIYDLGRSSSTHQGMGTTLVAGLFHGTQLFVVWSGDSRLYRFRAGRLRLVSRDHSLLNEYIRLRMVRPSEARAFPHRNVITKALGLKPHSEIEFVRRRVMPGDVYVLCSDGLNDMIEDARIADVVGGPGTLAQRCDLLVQAALDAGGADNVTVLMVGVP